MFDHFFMRDFALASFSARTLRQRFRQMDGRFLCDGRTVTQNAPICQASINCRRRWKESLTSKNSQQKNQRLVTSTPTIFYKRQLTWFRAQKNLEWIELKPDELPETVVADLQRRRRIKE